MKCKTIKLPGETKENTFITLDFIKINNFCYQYIQ